MQKLLTRIKILGTHSNHPDSIWLLEMIIRDIKEDVNGDKSFIKEEKKAIVTAHRKGLENIECDECACLGHQDDMAEQYYEETFKL